MFTNVHTDERVNRAAGSVECVSSASGSLRHKVGAVGQHKAPSAAKRLRSNREAARRAAECRPARDPGLDPGGLSPAARRVRRHGITPVTSLPVQTQSVSCNAAMCWTKVSPIARPRFTGTAFPMRRPRVAKHTGSSSRKNEYVRGKPWSIAASRRLIARCCSGCPNRPFP